MHGPSVLPNFPPADRNEILKTVARTLLRLRANGWTCEALGAEIGVTGETIANASNELSMLGFEPIVALGHKFPEARALLLSLWGLGVEAAPTIPERVDTIRRHLAAIERETAA
jgi:hypothetical protein